MLLRSGWGIPRGIPESIRGQCSWLYRSPHEISWCEPYDHTYPMFRYFGQLRLLTLHVPSNQLMCGSGPAIWRCWTFTMTPPFILDSSWLPHNAVLAHSRRCRQQLPPVPNSGWVLLRSNYTKSAGCRLRDHPQEDSQMANAPPGRHRVKDRHVMPSQVAESSL